MATFSGVAQAENFGNKDVALIVKTNQVNELRFVRDFKGRSFEDRGRISHIGAGSIGDTVILSISMGTDIGLRCILSAGAAQDAADWDQDDFVAVSGTIRETASGDLILAPCIAHRAASTVPSGPVASTAPARPIGLASAATGAAFAFQPIPGFDALNSRPVPRAKPGVAAQPVFVLVPSSTVPSPSPSLLTTSDEQQAADRIVALYAFWSQSNDGLQSFGDFYAEKVNYYGSATPRSQIVKEKMTFSLRWPIRRYVTEPASLRVVCLPASCTVSGVVGWSVVSGERSARSAGTATFTYTLDVAKRIIAENGQVLARQP